MCLRSRVQPRESPAADTVSLSVCHPAIQIMEDPFRVVFAAGLQDIMKARRGSMDSFSSGVSDASNCYTTQCTTVNLSMAAGIRSSPLMGAATTGAAACSPPVNSLEHVDLDEEMERMVSSVVNSPVEPTVGTQPSPPTSAISSLGLNLPGPLQSQQSQARQALSSASSRSLLGSNHNTPKMNMGTRAAFGAYRKRCLSSTCSPVLFI